MTTAVLKATAKLQLDEETGEMVSKNELKRIQKRIKKEAHVKETATHANSTKEAVSTKPDDPPEVNLILMPCSSKAFLPLSTRNGL